MVYYTCPKEQGPQTCGTEFQAIIFQGFSIRGSQKKSKKTAKTLDKLPQVWYTKDVPREGTKKQGW